MTSNDLLQFQSIGLEIALLCFIGHKLEDMQYTFWNIAVNYIKWLFYGLVHDRWYASYILPMRWLTSNLIYLYYAILGLGEGFLLFGLLQQVRLNQVEDKSMSFFVGSPIVTIAFFLIIRYYEVHNYTPDYRKH
jgi:hypothetical protein